MTAGDAERGPYCHAVDRRNSGSYDASHFIRSMKGIHIMVDRRTRVCCLLIAAALATAATAMAHHSFAMFDQTKPVTLNGTVTEFQWTNPHAYIEIDVADEKGAIQHWSVEMGSPSI